MRIDIVTIFPEYFAPFDISLLGRARERGVLDIRVHQLRDWAHDVHRTVDDSPYGGGPGMVMKPEPWGEALDSVVSEGTRIVVPTPSGRPFDQARAVRYAREPHLVFACGRYEGVDARVMEHYANVDELSIGDYVLAGGEAATLVIVEAIARLLPGVVGNADSVTDDSFAPGAMESLLEGPVYTKPASWRGHDVPEILLSGHHAAIARWRRDEALRRTARHRPDLIRRLEGLDGHDLDVLSEAGFQIGPEDMAN